MLLNGPTLLYMYMYRLALYCVNIAPPQLMMLFFYVYFFFIEGMRLHHTILISKLCILFEIKSHRKHFENKEVMSLYWFCFIFYFQEIISQKTIPLKGCTFRNHS